MNEVPQLNEQVFTFPATTIVRDSANNYALMKNDQAAACPYLQPIAVQNPLDGKVHMQRITCSTNCPFASVEMRTHKEYSTNPANKFSVNMQETDVTNYYYVTKCSGMEVRTHIGNQLPDEKNSKGLVSV